MSLSLRWIQRRDLAVLQMLKGAEGVSSLELTLGDGAGVQFQESQIASLGSQFETEPLDGVFSLTDTPSLGAGLANQFDLAFAKDVGQVVPEGWVDILRVSHDQPAGTSFAIELQVDAALDDAGANILGVVIAPSADYRHVSPTAAQAAEAALLDALIPPMGMTASDSIGRKHMSEYEPSSPLSTFDFPQGPIVNANLNFEEYSALVRVGFLSRGIGANSYRLFLTEAGKRSAGFPLV
jgi:hypothetical protein